MIGRQFGPYIVQAPLGEGGMGEVYLASDPRLGRDVAIKVLPPEYSRDADRLRRFELEARAAAAPFPCARASTTPSRSRAGWRRRTTRASCIAI
jgi:serine/threonine protein kinase